jgi:hypothetical protein
MHVFFQSPWRQIYTFIGWITLLATTMKAFLLWCWRQIQDGWLPYWLCYAVCWIAPYLTNFIQALYVGLLNLMFPAMVTGPSGTPTATLRSVLFSDILNSSKLERQ